MAEPDPGTPDAPAPDAPTFHVVDAPMPDADPVPDHTATKTRRKPLFRTDRPEPTTRPLKRKPAIPKRKGQFIAPLENLYTSVGIMLMPFDAVCGNAVLQSAAQCAKSLDDLAHQNDAVRRLIYALVQTSALGAVIAAHAPILLAVAMHHVPAIQNAMGAAGSQMAENIAEQMRATQPPGTGDDTA